MQLRCPRLPRTSGAWQAIVTGPSCGTATHARCNRCKQFRWSVAAAAWSAGFCSCRTYSAAQAALMLTCELSSASAHSNRTCGSHSGEGGACCGEQGCCVWSHRQRTMAHCRPAAQVVVAKSELAVPAKSMPHLTHPPTHCFDQRVAGRFSPALVAMQQGSGEVVRSTARREQLAGAAGQGAEAGQRAVDRLLGACREGQVARAVSVGTLSSRGRGCLHPGNWRSASQPIDVSAQP